MNNDAWAALLIMLFFVWIMAGIWSAVNTFYFWTHNPCCMYCRNRPYGWGNWFVLIMFLLPIVVAGWVSI